MNRLSQLERSSLIEKQRKKAHSVKLEMKALFLRKDFQNLTMISTQELIYLDSLFNGPELVKLSLKKLKCKKILSGTRKLKFFAKPSLFVSKEKNKNEQVPFEFFNFLKNNLDFLKFWLEKFSKNSENTKKTLRKCLKGLIKKRNIEDSKRNDVSTIFPIFIFNNTK